MAERDFRLNPFPAGMVPSSVTDPATFTTEDRVELDYTAFASAEGGLSCGVWECAPCREEIASFPVDEMMVVIAGSVTLTHADGRAETFGPGDALFVARGSALTWEITERLRKYYMISA